MIYRETKLAAMGKLVTVGFVREVKVGENGIMDYPCCLAKLDCVGHSINVTQESYLWCSSAVW